MAANLFLAGLFGAIGGVVSLGAGYSLIQVVNALLREPKKLSEFKPGEEGESVGTITSDKPIQAPKSRDDCVWYKDDIQEQRRTSTDENAPYEWRSVKKREGSVTFKITDGVRELVADISKAELNPKTRTFKASSDDRRFAGISSGLLSNPARVVESWIPNNARVYVVGKLDGSAKKFRINSLSVGSKAGYILTKAVMTIIMGFIGLALLIAAIILL